MVGVAVAIAATTGCGSDGPAAGTEGGDCYGNGTCNAGLVCLSDHCVDLNDLPDAGGPDVAAPVPDAPVADARVPDARVPDARGPDAPPPDAPPPLFCGDGIVSGSELCDIAIPAGDTGACPTSCAPPSACTTVTLLGAGTCLAVCDVGAIVDAIDDDGCCPPGMDANLDNDCPPVCGNAVVEPGEDCDDGGTTPGDGCDGTCMCEVGVCGDGVVGCSEQCDDGGTTPGDGCDDLCLSEPTAFRASELYLREPHVFALIVDILCLDITDMPLDQCGLNCELQSSISSDTDADGLLDLNVLTVFRPLVAPGVPTTTADFLIGECTVAMECSPGPTPDIFTRAITNHPPGGPDCLGPLAGTLHAPPYTPTFSSTPAPCGRSEPGPLTLSLSGLDLQFSHAEIAAMYVGDPATDLASGLIRAFMTEADADATIIPATLPFVAGLPLSQILPGGTNNCECDHGVIPGGCQSDIDVGPDGVTLGWYFYFEFRAEAVSWTE